MDALKALVKRQKAPQACFTSLTGSWDLLASPENYLEGVLLLARQVVEDLNLRLNIVFFSVPSAYSKIKYCLYPYRALVKHHHGLDYAVFTKVIPLLHHGDDQQKLTAMAFFTAVCLFSCLSSILRNKIAIEYKCGPSRTQNLNAFVFASLFAFRHHEEQAMVKRKHSIAVPADTVLYIY